MSRYSNKGTRRLHRARDGMIFGVCKGLADYADINVFWLRLLAVGSLFITGFGPVILIYVVAAIFMRPAPVITAINDEDYEFYNTYSEDRSLALQRLKRKFDSLDRRTSQMESIVTDREYDWNRRFNAGA
jgi:phage shock protein C